MNNQITTPFHFDLIDVENLIEKFEEMRDSEVKEKIVRKHECSCGNVWHAPVETWGEKFPSTKLYGEVTQWCPKCGDSPMMSGPHETLHVPSNSAYFCMVEDLLRELAGNGGDVQWEGEWYPAVLIHEDYFTDYTRELMMDCEMLPRDLPEWVEIDWESTACNVRVMDYTSIEVDGVTYWYR